MSLCKVNFRGESVGKFMEMNVVVPDGKGPFPVMYLLHGYSDDYSNWQRYSNVERHADGKKLIVVMPDGHRSFYCNDPRPGGYAFEDHIVKDVVGYVDRTFHTIPNRRARATAGLSMGGYGCTMLALRHPDVFSVACAHSAAMAFGHPQPGKKNDLKPLVGKDVEKYDLHALARKPLKTGPKVALRFDCGVDDFLIQDNRAFHAHLDKIGYKHEYHEFPGAHTWDYWDLHVRESIAFALEHMKTK